MSELHRDKPDTTDRRDRKLREGVRVVETEYDDRWPARGPTGVRNGEYRPLDDVSREERQAPYRKYPSG